MDGGRQGRVFHAARWGGSAQMRWAASRAALLAGVGVKRRGDFPNGPTNFDPHTGPKGEGDGRHSHVGWQKLDDLGGIYRDLFVGVVGEDYEHLGEPSARWWIWLT